MSPQYHRTIAASGLGAVGVDLPDTIRRECYWCGLRKTVNGRTKRNDQYMCGDCKSVDPAMARRLGLK